MGFAKFMATPLGRGIRIVAGLAMMYWGSQQGTTTGTIVAVLGLLPTAAGALNLCFIAPIIGAPFRGQDAR